MQTIKGNDKVEYEALIFNSRNTAALIKLGAIKVWVARERARNLAEKAGASKYIVQCQIDNWFEEYENTQKGFYNWDKVSWSA